MNENFRSSIPKENWRGAFAKARSESSENREREKRAERVSKAHGGALWKHKQKEENMLVAVNKTIVRETMETLGAMQFILERVEQMKLLLQYSALASQTPCTIFPNDILVSG